MASIKHNKKRNSGLVFEFLVRRLASQVLGKDKTGYNKTVQIVKKYYSAGQPLAEEVKIFDIITATRGVSTSTAEAVINEVKTYAKTLNKKLIEIKKSNLIKEINYTFGKDFFSIHHVPEYRLLASIQVLLDESTSNKLDERVSGIHIEESLVKYMTSTGKFTTLKTVNREVDSLVCGLATKRFQETYTNSLSRGQKAILQRYMGLEMLGNMTKMSKFLTEQKILLTNDLKRHASSKVITDDLVMKDRFSEAILMLENEESQKPEDMVQDMMLFKKLVEELESDG